MVCAWGERVFWREREARVKMLGEKERGTSKDGMCTLMSGPHMYFDE